MTTSRPSAGGLRPNHFSESLAIVPSFFMQSSASWSSARSFGLFLGTGAAQWARVSLSSRSATNCGFFDAAGLHTRDQGREAHRVDRDLALHAARHLGEEVDLEALDAAAQLGHGVRGEGAVDAGPERWKFLLGERGSPAEKRGCSNGGKATLHHDEPPKERVVFLRVEHPCREQP